MTYEGVEVELCAFLTLSTTEWSSSVPDALFLGKEPSVPIACEAQTHRPCWYMRSSRPRHDHWNCSGVVCSYGTCPWITRVAARRCLLLIVTSGAAITFCYCAPHAL